MQTEETESWWGEIRDFWASITGYLSADVLQADAQWVAQARDELRAIYSIIRIAPDVITVEDAHTDIVTTTRLLIVALDAVAQENHPAADIMLQQATRSMTNSHLSLFAIGIDPHDVSLSNDDIFNFYTELGIAV